MKVIRDCDPADPLPRARIQFDGDAVSFATSVYTFDRAFLIA